MLAVHLKHVYTKNMPKVTVNYVCVECAAEHAKWAGRCPACGAWNTLEEAAQSERPRGSAASALPTTSLSEVTADTVTRLQTGSAEFNRVLGGGFVPGSVILLGGEPGIGKSTLLLQMCGSVASEGTVLYISGEESREQIGLRAKRLGIHDPGIHLLAATDADSIIQTIVSAKPSLVIIDSIQTLFTDRFQSGPGSITQVRESAARLQIAAKEHAIPIALVGHVTKEGTIAGPKVLEHLVDAVLSLEGDKYHGFRLLRGAKNRFGPTDEVGVFSMDEDGMQDVADAAGMFAAERNKPVPGTGLTASLEGTRVLMAELQALTVETSFGYPKRTANGFDLNKLQLLVAVLSRHVGLKLASSDVYFNVSGGYRVTEPAADLAAALTVASALQNRPMVPHSVALGEVGLSGEVRPVQSIAKRLEESARAGVTTAIIPHQAIKRTVPGIKTIQVRTVAEAVKASQEVGIRAS